MLVVILPDFQRRRFEEQAGRNITGSRFSQQKPSARKSGWHSNFHNFFQFIRRAVDWLLRTNPFILSSLTIRLTLLPLPARILPFPPVPALKFIAPAHFRFPMVELLTRPLSFRHT
jgi:hypothetical protein